MRTSIAIVFGLSVAMFLGAQDKSEPVDSLSARVHAANTAAFNLWRKIDDGKKDAVCSPHSISEAMTMVWAATEGPAHDEIGAAFGLPMPVADTLGIVHRLSDRLTGGGKKQASDLLSANRFWLARGVEYRRTYIDDMRRYFEAGIEMIDFSDPEAARLKVNAWVESQTAKMIKDLLPPGSVAADSKLLLANAVYFKAAWKTPFHPMETTESMFTKVDGSKTKMPIMHGSFEFRHAAIDGGEIAALPYVSDEFAFVAVLPAKDKTLADLEKTINADAFLAWRSQLKKTEMPIALPKMKIESTFDLAGAPFGAIGVKTVFTKDARWTLVADPKKDVVEVDRVLHKAVIVVDENGTTAAAATAVGKRGGPPKGFYATRPFLFAIVHEKTGLVVFVGRFTGES